MVQTSNAIYRAMLGVIDVLLAEGAPWAIEGQLRSLLWWMPEVDGLRRRGATDDNRGDRRYV